MRFAVWSGAARSLALGAAIALGSAALTPGTVLAQSGPVSVADLAERLIGSVVNISTSQNVAGSGPSRGPAPRAPDGSPFQEFFDDFFKQEREGQRPPGRRRGGPTSLGSGFVVDASGVIVTNNHVIEGADEIRVEFVDGTELKATVVGTDAKTDIAVLQVEPVKPLRAVPFGDSAASRVGDWVMAIGNPFGQGGTVTLGIISAMNRNINSGPYDNFIQTDASINRGNSGGPLFNMAGEVVGINTAIISPSGGSIGIGFSVPSKLATNVIAQLREFGETRRGWLGVSIQPVTAEIAESLDMERPTGAMIAGVTNNGPAKAAGLKPGDVIVELNGSAIPDPRRLQRVVADTEVGLAVDVVVLRKGERETYKVTLGRLEDGEKIALAQQGGGDEGDETAAQALGMTFGVLDDEARATFELADDAKGVLVTEVEEGSAADEKGIVAGNLILEIGQEEVKTPQDVAARLAALKDDGRQNALLLVAQSNGDLQFVVLRIE